MDYGYLAHHGIKGQKWGIRRYQNEDGSLTEAGRRRYGYVGSPLDSYSRKLQPFTSSARRGEARRLQDVASTVRHERGLKKTFSKENFKKVLTGKNDFIDEDAIKKYYKDHGMNYDLDNAAYRYQEIIRKKAEAGALAGLGMTYGNLLGAAIGAIAGSTLSEYYQNSPRRELWLNETQKAVNNLEDFKLLSKMSNNIMENMNDSNSNLRKEDLSYINKRQDEMIEKLGGYGNLREALKTNNKSNKKSLIGKIKKIKK